MLKILLKNRLLALADQLTGQSKGKKAAKLGTYAVLIVLGILILIGCCAGVNALFGNTCVRLAERGEVWAVYGFAGAAGFLLALFLTLFYAQGVIFEAKDNELLLSMPISPSAILASRVGSVYFLNSLFTLVMLCAAGYTVSAQTGGIGVLNWILVIVCALLLPLLSTTISCLLAWLVSYITRRTGRKVLVQTILSLVAIAALFLVTMGVNRNFFSTFAESAGDIAQAFRRSLYPLYAMGLAIAETNWGMLAIFAAICIVPFAIVYYVLSRSFIRIVTARNAAKKQKYEATALKGSSVVWSMTKKDLTRFFSSPPYMTNAGLGLLYSIGLTIFAMVSGDSVIRNILEKTDRISDPGAYTTVIAAFVISFFAALTTISGCSVSVEGKNLWILKSMPVRAKDVLTGKLLSHLVLAIPVSVLCSILYLFVAKILTVPGVILMFLMPIAFNCFNALFGLISNLHFGKLDYPSIAKAAKSTTSSLIPILATILLVIGSAVLYFTALHGKIDVTVYGIIVTAVIFAVDLCMFSYLGSNGAQKRWDELGQ